MIVFDQLKKNDPTLRVVTWSVLGGMAILLAGLWWVQIISNRHYSENQKAQSFRTVRIPAIRGKILDRNGAPLAENQPNYSVGLYLDEFRDQFKAEWKRTRAIANAASKARPSQGKPSRAERAALDTKWIALESETRFRVASNIMQTVGAIMDQPVELDYEAFRKHYSEQLALPMPVVSGLNAAQIARFQERSINLPGVDLDMQPTRIYPGGTTAAHLLGYLQKDNSSAEDEDAFFNFRLPDWRGRLGIEGVFDTELRGKAGVKSVQVNSLGYRQSETIWTQAEAGKNIYLTLDLEIQQEAERALQTADAHRHGGAVHGAVVVLNPQTGDILALASAPSYDLNKFIPNISREDYAALTNMELRPLINRATQENYAPGSIFKIVTALACLESGLNPKEKIYSPGHIYIGRRRIDDTAPAGEYDFKRAFVKSSNTYFITNGLRAGIEQFAKIGTRLHLGERTGLPTGQEVSGFFPQSRHISVGWTAGDTANLCIGQGKLDVTPLQMAVMIAAIASDGNVVWPRLVDRIVPVDPNSGVLPIKFPQRPPRDHLGVAPRSLEIIREAMLADVEDPEGTGKAASVPGMRVCGKTGTAQVTDVRGRVVDWTTWFASYAPFENPRYVVIVMVESGRSGGGTCAPVAARIYRALQKMETRRQPTLASSPP